MIGQLADPVAEAYAAATERREQRRNHYTAYTEQEELQAKLEGRTLERVSLYAPPFRPPETAAEFWDDCVVQYGDAQKRGWPELRFVAGLAAAARDGGGPAAVKMVREARRLEPKQQHAAFENLKALSGDADALRTGAARVVAGALAEWPKQRLAQWPDGMAADRRPAATA